MTTCRVCEQLGAFPAPAATPTGALDLCAVCERLARGALCPDGADVLVARFARRAVAAMRAQVWREADRELARARRTARG